MNRKCLLVIAWLAVSAVIFAKDEVKNPNWLTADEIQAIVLQESPPPAPGSVEEQTDLQAELDAQNTRTPERIAEAKVDAHYSLDLFSNVIGFKITEASYPLTFRFFQDLLQQIDTVAVESKNHWRRPRPFRDHSEIHPLFELASPSYPSGHSTSAFAYAVILGRLFPDKFQAFLDRARQIAQSRVDAGVHYMSDIKEGEVVGKECAKELLAKPVFQAALNSAKTELTQRK